MVQEQIRNRGISDQPILEAMEKVPRHLFIPAEIRQFAYQDSPLPIGYGQTISQPYIVAYMTSKISLSKLSRVLEVGTGSGYQAAVLSVLADSVYTIEIVPELATSSAKILNKLGYLNVRCKQGDGYKGWPEYKPFDAILVTAAASEIPPALLDQLKEGGKLIMPVGLQDEIQNLVIVTRKQNKYLKKTLIPVRFVPFTRE